MGHFCPPGSGGGGSGFTDLIESGSSTDPDPKPWLEDAVISLRDETDGTLKVRTYTILRQAVASLARQYAKLETAANSGWDRAVEMDEKGDEVEGMTEEKEEAEKSRKNIQTRNDDNGGKVKKKRVRTKKYKATPYDKSDAGSSGGASGQGPSWGGGWPPAASFASPMNGWVALAGGGPPGTVRGGGGAGQYAYEGNYSDGGNKGGKYRGKRQRGSGGGGGNGGNVGGGNGGSGNGGGGKGGSGIKKRIYPCKNCGSKEHWKQSPACPKHQIYLDAQKAKSLEKKGAWLLY